MILPEAMGGAANKQTIRSLLAATPSEHRLDTELLIARALNWTRARVLAFDETPVTGSTLERLLAELTRLERGEPLAYITGEREFFSLSFAVSPEVLIPRPETELLVELAIERAPEGANVVDLGTGSGAIAIALKHARPDLTITATDQSTAALTVAAHNAARHRADVRFLRSHWYEALLGKFDMILSNPPYVAEGDPHLPALRFEPASALVSGPDGLSDLRAITSGATRYLNNGGWLLVEHGSDQQLQVARLCECAGLRSVTAHTDLSGHPRVTSAQCNPDA